MLHAVGKGTVAKEAIPEILVAVAVGSTVEAAMAQSGPDCLPRRTRSGDKEDCHRPGAEFVIQKQKGALGPLMGLVMQEVWGSVDGKVVSELLKKEIEMVLAGKK